jgi:membrane protein
MPLSRLKDLARLKDLDWDLSHWTRSALKIAGRALTRLWGRDVMLYTGGVSFFVMLAVFPGLAILVGLYSLMADPAEAAPRAEFLASLMPAGARQLFLGELDRMAYAPVDAVSAQSVVALVIGAYAAHRGFKALLAGLSFIHEEDNQRGFLGFNIMALLVLVGAFGLLVLLVGVFLGLRLISAAFGLKPLAGVSWIYSEWTWTSLGMGLAFTLVYRYAMSRDPVEWRASVIGGGAAAALCMLASWACAVYVEQVAALGVTYGSLTAVVVFLIWLSWNVNAVFFGGALATEIEVAEARVSPASPRES